jgi:hypothetical protein
MKVGDKVTITMEVAETLGDMVFLVCDGKKIRSRASGWMHVDDCKPVETEVVEQPSKNNPMRVLLDQIKKQAQSQRSETQMTLGKLIDRLSQLDPAMGIDGLCEPHSYRGYYSDLAFERCNDKRTVADVLAMAKDCMGETFQGYKGGNFDMTMSTPVWVADYGSCGMKIMSVDDKGSLTLAKDE